MAYYYRYTVESIDGHFETRDAAFESDTEARVKLYEWFMRQVQLMTIMLFKYDQLDTCGTYHRIDRYCKPGIIYF